MRTTKGQGTGDGVSNIPVIESVKPLAMFPAYSSASYLAGLSSQEMIPPLRGLSSMVFSAGDTYMSDAESILGKREAANREGESEDKTRALVLTEDGGEEGRQKKGRREVTKMNNQGGGSSNLEATSLGAAGKLTGSRVATRQQQ
jgi:hypothetical protein